MALGDSYNYNGSNNTDNNKKQYRSPEVYSAYNTSNETGVDPSALSYSFWNGLLKISIAPILKNPTEKQKWDHKNASSVYLTHRIARIVYNEAKSVIAGEKDNGGSRTGQSGLITFSNGKEVGCAGPCIIIRSIESDGTITATYVYEFRRGFHYGVSNFRADTSDFEKTYYDDTEVNEFLSILDQFATAMSKATAYTVIDEMKYDNNRMNTKIGLIAEALGVEFNGGNSNNNSRGGSSYFDNNGGNSGSNTAQKRSSTRQMTLDEVAGAMNPPEDD